MNNTVLRMYDSERIYFCILQREFLLVPTMKIISLVPTMRIISLVPTMRIISLVPTMKNMLLVPMMKIHH